MTKYLETKKNSIEEAISSVVLDEKFSITLPPTRGGKKLLNIDMGRAIRMLKDFGATKSDIRHALSGKGGRFQNAGGEMFFVQRESVELGEAKYEVQYTVSSRVGDSRSRTKSRLSKIDIDARSKEDAEKKFFKQAEKSPMMKDAMRRDMLDVVYVGLKEELDEEMRVFFVSDKNSEGNVHAKNEKDAIAQAKKKGLKGKISVRDKGPVSMATRGRRESVELDEGKRISPKMLNLMKVITAYKQEKPGSKERQNMLNFINKELKAMGKQPIKDSGIQTLRLGEGYESEVLKVLKDADIDGYFKMGKLYVSKRDAKDAKKALEDSDEITKLPKMVMEDERMKKLTPRQRQALARVQAKPKSQVSLPKMPDFMKLKKEENEMDIVDTIRNIVEKKLDPVDKDAVKKKFDDRKDKDIDNDGDVDSTDKYLHKRRKAISKAISKEAYDIGKDYAQHTLDVTPGQDKKDVDKMLNTAYTKNQSMRETLAKVWGLGEGKSPFQKEEEKPLTKTMTGQKPTKVEVEPKMEKK